MESRFYDFAILGDTHPEGLYLAAGLARRGFSVCIVPSPQLGELPVQFPWPLRLPERIGEKRFDELLFRVGFFRLEESGLSPSPYQSQVVLKRNRLSFDGAPQTWDREVKREFPQYSEKLLKIRDGMRRSSLRSLPKSVGQLAQLAREDANLKDWLTMESGQGRQAFHSSAAEQRSSWERWLWSLAWPESKSYRVQKNLSQPFSEFLVEHSKKWGTQVLDESVQISSRFRHFELTPQVRARNLVINTLAGFRSLAKIQPEKFSHHISHWLYYDRLSCEIEKIPEPLEELCQIHLSDSDEFPYLLHTSRTKLRDRAQLTLGVWLPFQDSSAWVLKIEQARQSLHKLMSFLPENSFSEVPSLLELNELKGECVRRGEIQRLMIRETQPAGWAKVQRTFEAMIAGKSKLPKLAPRVFLSMPYLKFHQDRRASLASCYHLLEHFEKKRAKLGASKLW